MATQELLIKRCDNCGDYLECFPEEKWKRFVKLSPGNFANVFSSHTEADRTAREAGWYVDARKCFCADCREEDLTLP